MLVDLIQVTTRDGVRLDGSFQRAERSHGGVDAALCVHGTGSNFYGSTLFDELATCLLQIGIGVLRINTRGHDLVSTASTSRGGRRLGAAYELLDECRHDLAAWIGWLSSLGASRVLLIGHSAGALKCLYHLAFENEPTVRGIVAASPPRLSHSGFSRSSKSAVFLNTMQQAEALVSAGEPASLLDVTMPLPFITTAAGYVEKYGPDERYNYEKFLDRVRCPVLVTLGEKELRDNVAFQQADEMIRRIAPSVQVETISGADHFYTGVRASLSETILSWIATLR